MSGGKMSSECSNAIMEYEVEIDVGLMVDPLTLEPEPSSPSKPHSPAADKEKPVINSRELIAIALRNCAAGSLSSRQICNFLAEQFTFFASNTKYWSKVVIDKLSNQSKWKTVWFKNSAPAHGRHYVWHISPEKIALIEQALASLARTKESAVKGVLINPENFAAIMKGDLGWSPTIERNARVKGDV